MAIKLPPYVNGICSFIDDQTICDAVTIKLAEIRESFTATDEQPICDTFYITATYNRTIADTDLNTTTKYPFINGDTTEACLAQYDATQNPSQEG